MAYRLDKADEHIRDTPEDAPVVAELGCRGKDAPGLAGRVASNLRPEASSRAKEILTSDSRQDAKPRYEQEKEGITWRRAREYGWPAVRQHDGKVKISMAPAFDYQRFIHNPVENSPDT